jgi:hypothetical protein
MEHARSLALKNRSHLIADAFQIAETMILA